MLTDIELIRKIEFFEALEPKVLKQIAEMCIVREFASGEYIVRQGESGLGLYFITAGKAKVEIDRNDVKVVVAELKEGDTLGEFSIIDEKARSANVICMEETRCLLLTRDSFQKVMKKHPEIANQMLKTLVGRIRTVNERISSNPVSTAPRGAADPASQTTPQPEAAPGDAPAAAQDGLLGKLGAYMPPMPSLSDIPHPSEVFKLYAATKTKTREYLNEMIGSIYAMKAMMRFSMAVVGCPVRVHAEQPEADVMTAELGGVKLLLFPSGVERNLLIDAYGDGDLHATVYCPHSDGVEVTTIDGAVAREESYQLLLPSDGKARIQPHENCAAGWNPRWNIVRSRLS